MAHAARGGGRPATSRSHGRDGTLACVPPPPATVGHVPVTPSHVVAVLPLIGRSGRIPAAALVLGSMAPDYPWFLTGGRSAGLSHSFAGLVTVDLAVGLLAFVLWRSVGQAPVRDLMPRMVGARLPDPLPLTGRELPWAAAGVLIGALTHIVWDSFTHTGRPGVDAVTWLAAGHAGLPGSKWAQYLSGVLGAAVLVVWCVRRLRATPPAPDWGGASLRGRLLAWGVVAAGLVLGAMVGVVTADGSIERMAFRAVTRGGLGAALAVVLVCLVWWARRSRPPGRATEAHARTQ